MSRGAPPVPAFGPEWLAPRIARLSSPAQRAAPRFVVAWSGGADSTALLAALCELRSRSRDFALRALHVDHGLHPEAGEWARHCRRVARRLRVPLVVLKVDASALPGQSREAAARLARYRAFEAALAPGETLLLAQHAGDQLETLLLQLLRGAGLAGLAAMPECRALGQGRLARPMLEARPEALRDWLVRQSLPWIEDPSNTDIDLDRNYLRHEVLPRLARRWPGVRETTARSVALLQEARRELDARDARRLALVADGDGLSLPLLRRLPAERARAVVRAWLSSAAVVLPDRAHIAAIAELASLREDARPAVTWGSHAVRRHRERLVLSTSARGGVTEPDRLWRWTSRAPLAWAGGTLRIVADPHGDVDLARLPRTLLVRARARGREREPGGGSVDVKSLLRESDVPSWQRAALPFLHDPRGAGERGSLIAIGDLWVARAARSDDSSRRRGRILWRPR